MGMFDTQPAQAVGQDPQQQAGRDTSQSSNPLTESSLDQFNQHILLTVQAVNRIKALLSP